MPSGSEQLRGVGESFDPYLLRDGLTSTVSRLDPLSQTSSESLELIPDTPRMKELTRKPSLVLRSRSVRNFSERYPDNSGQSVRQDDDGKPRTIRWGPKITLLVISLWFTVAVIVLFQMPWGDFELRWVKKRIADVQWLYPISRPECTVGQTMQTPVATCGLPQLANANFAPGISISKKPPQYKHNPNLIEALRVISPSRDYKGLFDFVGEGTLRALPAADMAAGFQDFNELQPADTNPPVEPQAALTEAPAEEPSQPRSKPNLTENAGFAFKRFKAGTLNHDSVVWCDGSNEPDETWISPLPPNQPVLFLLGAQQAGTGWLAKSLASHPGFVGPTHAYRQPQDTSSNELHFFDRWPMPPPEAFLDCFPSNSIVHSPKQQAQMVLVDATPDYLFNSAAAPRIKALVPKARFVVILRDPVARAYLAWKTAHAASCSGGTDACTFPSFATSAANSVSASQASGCLFNTSSNSRTWHTCFQCHFSHYDDDACNALTTSDRGASPHCRDRRGFGIVDVSNYAAQVAWWLSFFPSEQFLFISHSQLQDMEGRLAALARVAAHTGIETIQPFSQDMVADLADDNSKWDISYEDKEAVLMLRRLFDKSEEDLYKLLALHGQLGASFPGFPSEMR